MKISPINSLNVGDKTRFSVTGAKTTLIYSTSDKTVASIDSKGNITALKPGTVTVDLQLKLNSGGCGQYDFSGGGNYLLF